jgi:CBS domain-containing protein
VEIEQLEVLTFLQEHVPFRWLPEDELTQLAKAVDVAYFRADTDIVKLGEEHSDLYVIRSGSVEIFRRNGDLYNRLGVGGIFGQQSLLTHSPSRFPARALEDTLIYLIPKPVFIRLFEYYDRFSDFVEIHNHKRLNQTVNRHQDANELMTSSVSKLITRPPVMIEAQQSVQTLAITMTEETVSSMLVVESMAEGEEASVVGIVTDRDLRTRVVAEGLPLDTPICEIMSDDLITIEASHFVFEAMLTMLKNNVHHLPVLSGGKPIGVIGISDIIRYESHNSLFVVSSIFDAPSISAMAQLKSDMQASFVRMVNEDANSHMIGSAMSVIGRSVKQRLLEMAEESLGPPPVPYCFLALGSMARDEQLIVTDQDNALILSDDYDEKLHGDYFLQLSRFVSDGLAECGYKYCKGNIMATNQRWRQPLSVWRDYFTQWIDSPTPETLLNSSIFFDLEGVAGEVRFADELRHLIANKARQSPHFLACLTRNALQRTPPLGFFKDFVLETDGEHRNTINLKRRGTAPLSDLIRVHALAIGSMALNSFERLDDIIAANILPEGRGPDLKDALEFISMVRIQHQAKAIEKGKKPDNNIKPSKISPFERRNLKDAFQILAGAQKFLPIKYPPGRRF